MRKTNKIFEQKEECIDGFSRKDSTEKKLLKNKMI